MFWNRRLSEWMESNTKLCDEQNGFRKKRSTIDHLSSLTNLVETRIKRKLSAFTAFIDFKKAYDSIHRNGLWNKLQHMGVNGKLFNAVKALYNNVTACVRLNTFTT